MNSDGSRQAAASQQPARIDAHRDARAVVRLIQCSICSYPLRTPVTLPCGNSVCKDCLPPSQHRPHVTYPALPARQYGYVCPIGECSQLHPAADCSVNVLLLNIMEAVHNHYRKAARSQPVLPQVSMDEVLQIPPPSSRVSLDSVEPEKGHMYSAPGGRLNATFEFAHKGKLNYTSDVGYEATNDLEAERVRDNECLDALRVSLQKEMECQVCYSLMLDPITTPCGHTYCRKCLARILDHSQLCPTCRRELFLPCSLSRQPSNKYLVELANSVCPDLVAARQELADIEERSNVEGLDTPLFPCTLAFPGLRTFLHIFEPRYRLMIRRAIERNGQFGMLAYNRYLEPQGPLGRTQFLEVGTMLQIERYQMLPDGRSFIECKGLHRFRVRAHGMMDGYIIANVEKMEDLSLGEEEQLEVEETTAPPAADEDANAAIARRPTNELRDSLLSFISRARQQSARWFSNRLLETYGEPPEDPAMLPYWLAAVLPLVDEEKYRVLPTSSIRERLKIAARWVHRIESQRWYVQPHVSPTYCNTVPRLTFCCA